MTDPQRKSLALLRFMIETNQFHVAWNIDDRLGQAVIEPIDASEMGPFSVHVTERGGLLFETMLDGDDLPASERESPFFFQLWPKSAHERLAMIARINDLIGDRIDPRD